MKNRLFLSKRQLLQCFRVRLLLLDSTALWLWAKVHLPTSFLTVVQPHFCRNSVCKSMNGVLCYSFICFSAHNRSKTYIYLVLCASSWQITIFCTAEAHAWSNAPYTMQCNAQHLACVNSNKRKYELFEVNWQCSSTTGMFNVSLSLWFCF